MMFLEDSVSKSLVDFLTFIAKTSEGSYAEEGSCPKLDKRFLAMQQKAEKGLLLLGATLPDYMSCD